MGCDIHFFTERLTTDDYQGPKSNSEKRDENINTLLNEESNKVERWVSVDTWKKERDWSSDDENATCWEVPYKSNLYRGRDYYLFAVLAGVRDYDNTIDKISEPRGIPDDASDGYKYQVDRWDGDAHSHSYFTLSELLAVDWDKYNKGENEGWLKGFMTTIENMKLIDDNPDKVRCVFFFDN